MAKSENATMLNGKELFAITCDDCGAFLYYVNAEGDLFNEEGNEMSYRDFRNLGAWAPDNHPELAYCHSCAEGQVECQHCGEIISRDDATVDSDGDYYCPDCTADHLYHCDRCDEWIYEGDLETVHTPHGDEEWCNGCVEDSTYRCTDCGELFEDGYGMMTYVDGYGYVCNDCFDRGDYTTCDDCGCAIRTDDARELFDEDDELIGTYCRGCARRQDPENHPIPGYHSDHTPWKFPDVDRRKVLITGTELEMEGGGESYKSALAISEAMGISHKKGLCRIEHDGSLSMGFEIITMPNTLKYFQEEIKLEEGFAEAVKRHYRSHDGGHCGAHVHIDREFFHDSMFNPEHALIIIVQNNRDWLQKFSRRDPSNMGYCRFYESSYKFVPDDFKPDEDGGNARMEQAKRRLRDMRYHYDGHSSALNFAGNSTMEIRFFRGTLKAQTLRANMELVHMIGYAMKHLNDVQLCNVDFKWFKRFAERKGYKNFLAYIEERGILA